MTAGTRDVPAPTTIAPSADLPPADLRTGELDGAPGLSRRRMFAMCSAGLLGAAALAACGSSSDGDGDDDSSSDAAAAPAASSPAAATSPPAAAGGEAAASGGTVLTKLSAVPVGGSISLSVGGRPVIVSQPTQGTAAAFSAICPHQGATVAVDGKILKCPLHGSTFAEATGKNISGPAAGRPLPPLNVSVSGGNVLLQS